MFSKTKGQGRNLLRIGAYWPRSDTKTQANTPGTPAQTATNKGHVNQMPMPKSIPNPKQADRQQMTFLSPQCEKGKHFANTAAIDQTTSGGGQSTEAARRHQDTEALFVWPIFMPHRVFRNANTVSLLPHARVKSFHLHPLSNVSQKV